MCDCFDRNSWVRAYVANNTALLNNFRASVTQDAVSWSQDDVSWLNIGALWSQDTVSWSNIDAFWTQDTVSRPKYEAKWVNFSRPFQNIRDNLEHLRTIVAYLHRNVRYWWVILSSGYNTKSNWCTIVTEVQYVVCTLNWIHTPGKYMGTNWWLILKNLLVPCFSSWTVRKFRTVAFITSQSQLSH